MRKGPYYSLLARKIAETSIVAGSIVVGGAFVYNEGYEHGVTDEQSKQEHVLGPDAYVIIDGKKYLARADTGATTSSIDYEIYRQGFGTPIGKRTIKNPNGSEVRYIVEGTVIIGDEEYTTEFTLKDRKSKGLTYPVLIGRKGLLEEGILVDCGREHIHDFSYDKTEALNEEDLHYLQSLREEQ